MEPDTKRKRNESFENHAFKEIDHLDYPHLAPRKIKFLKLNFPSFFIALIFLLLFLLMFISSSIDDQQQGYMYGEYNEMETEFNDVSISITITNKSPFSKAL